MIGDLTHVSFLYPGTDRRGLIACLETALAGHKPNTPYPLEDQLVHVRGAVQVYGPSVRIWLHLEQRVDQQMIYIVITSWRADFDVATPISEIAKTAADRIFARRHTVGF